jgi:predicted membrane-bound mannosyltransferase
MRTFDLNAVPEFADFADGWRRLVAAEESMTDDQRALLNLLFFDMLLLAVLGAPNLPGFNIPWAVYRAVVPLYIGMVLATLSIVPVADLNPSP